MKLTTYLYLPAFVLVMTCPAFAEPSFQVMLDDLLDGTVPQISPAELAKWQKDNDEKLPLLFDTRSDKEHRVSHLTGAQRVGFRDFSLKKVANLERDTPIVVFCSVGKRSEMIGEKLQKAGFTNVKNLRGGIFQWANEERPLVNDDGSTNHVHSYNRKWGQWLDAHVKSTR